jgi:hypothetical protein
MRIKGKTDMGKSAESPSAIIGFEKEIWDAANILRGNMDASSYQHMVLHLSAKGRIGMDQTVRWTVWWEFSLKTAPQAAKRLGKIGWEV